jgi:hypothetical protein
MAVKWGISQSFSQSIPSVRRRGRCAGYNASLTSWTAMSCAITSILSILDFRETDAWREWTLMNIDQQIMQISPGCFYKWFASESPKLIQIGGFDLLGCSCFSNHYLSAPTLGSQGTIVEARFITSATYYKVPGCAAANCYLQFASICHKVAVANSWFVTLYNLMCDCPPILWFSSLFEDGKLGNFITFFCDPVLIPLWPPVAAVARPLCWSPMPSWQLHCWQATCFALRWSAKHWWTMAMDENCCLSTQTYKIIQDHVWVCLTSKWGSQWPETCKTWPNFTCWHFT